MNSQFMVTTHSENSTPFTITLNLLLPLLSTSSATCTRKLPTLRDKENFYFIGVQNWVIYVTQQKSLTKWFQASHFKFLRRFAHLSLYYKIWYLFLSWSWFHWNLRFSGKVIISCFIVYHWTTNSKCLSVMIPFALNWNSMHIFRTKRKIRVDFPSWYLSFISGAVLGLNNEGVIHTTCCNEFLRVSRYILGENYML